MKTVEGFECYSIDEYGNVFSSKFGMVRKMKWLMMTGGYAFVILRKCKKSHSMSIHRLVALNFIENPLSKPQVNHKDGNKLNNHVSNLEWCTMAENNLHSYRTGLKKHHKCWLGKTGKDHNKSIPVMATFTDGKTETFGSSHEASRLTGIHQSTVYAAIKNKRPVKGIIFEQL